MRGGKLDRIVTIERRSQVQDPGGELVDGWEVVGMGRQFAEYLKKPGVERYLGPTLAATVMGAFRLRWFPNLIDIFPDTHRVKYTPIGGTENTFLIKGCTEINRREGVIIYWEGRGENPNAPEPEWQADA